MGFILELDICGGALCSRQPGGIAFVGGCIRAVHPHPSISWFSQRFESGGVSRRHGSGLHGLIWAGKRGQTIFFMSSSQLSSISPALSNLLAKSIDFAGAFPPASLSLSETLATFNRYLHGRESWLVGSIVLPINRLGACWMAHLFV